MDSLDDLRRTFFQECDELLATSRPACSRCATAPRGRTR